MTVGRRVAISLGGLAVVVIAGVLVLSVLTRRAPLPTAVDAVVGPPWAACAHEARRQLGGGAPIQGPSGARWAPSGEAVMLTGTASDADGRALAFGCDVRQVDAQWIVQTLVFQGS